MLHANNSDWNQTAFNVLAKNFGFKTNADAFLRLSQNIPYKIILKHNANILQLESLLFGQAGLLEDDFKEVYPLALKKEYKFLAAKYSIEDYKLNGSEWKFSKLRPPNFPTIRLSQLAAILCCQPQLFNFILELDSLNDLYKAFKISASQYWDTHYVFGTESKVESKNLGKSSIDNIVINTIVPLLVCYARERDEPRFLDKAIQLLDSIKAEQNNIIDTWQSYGIEIKTASDSQGSIELYNNYCLHRKCLDCSIGYSLINAEVCSM
jgi:hypothetical protein